MSSIPTITSLRSEVSLDFGIATLCREMEAESAWIQKGSDVLAFNALSTQEIDVPKVAGIIDTMTEEYLRMSRHNDHLFMGFAHTNLLCVWRWDFCICLTFRCRRNGYDQVIEAARDYLFKNTRAMQDPAPGTVRRVRRKKQAEVIL